MKIFALFVAVALTAQSAYAYTDTTTDRSPTKAVALLKNMQAQLSALTSTSTFDLSDLKNMPIDSNPKTGEWSTNLRHGFVTFRDRYGIGTYLTPQFDSIAILREDSLYLGLTIAPPTVTIPADRSFDLAPYLPGYRLYVYYRQNVFGEEYLSNEHPSPMETKIYQKILAELSSSGVAAR